MFCFYSALPLIRVILLHGERRPQTRWGGEGIQARIKGFIKVKKINLSVMSALALGLFRLGIVNKFLLFLAGELCNSLFIIKNQL